MGRIYLSNIIYYDTTFKELKLRLLARNATTNKGAAILLTKYQILVRGLSLKTMDSHQSLTLL